MENQTNKSRGKKIAKDFLIYSIGVIGSKLMTFLMLPLYTFHITDPAEYGYYDYCLSFVMLLMPIVTLQLRDGAFRFLLDTTDKKSRVKIITLINKLLVQTTGITLVIALIVYFVNPFKCLGYITLLLIIMSFYEVYSQTVRGLGNNRSFILMGLTASFSIGVLSVLFVAILKLGIDGIFLANILARVIAIVFVDWREKIMKNYIKPGLKQFGTYKRDIIKFSLPLLPTAICWWFIGFSNRYFINEYLNLHDIGIYSVASRLAIVVQTISIIFFQTWQENAIQQYHSPDRNRFFTKIFNIYIIAFIAITLIYTYAAKIIFPHIFDANYLESMNYLYQLCVATFIFALSTYFEVIYHCEKKTKRLLPPVIAAPFISIILNWLLITPMGINGTIISYAATYLVIVVYRWIDVKKFVSLKIYPTTYVPITLMVIGAIPFIFKTNFLIDTAIITLSMATLYISPVFREEIIKKVAKRFKK